MRSLLATPLSAWFAAAIIIVLGITLAQHWNEWAAFGRAAVCSHPPAVGMDCHGWHENPGLQRATIGWLGIRGIGSINYIAWAYTHGLSGAEATRMADMAFTLIVASVVVHGISVTPLLNWRQARRSRK